MASQLTDMLRFAWTCGSHRLRSIPGAAGAALFACALVAPLLAAIPGSGAAQEVNPLLRRWVGNHRGRPLHLDFYGDTMLVVSDRLVADFVTVPDSIIVFGDTSFAVHYRFARGVPATETWLILQTQDGSVITMTPQPALARPLRGLFTGRSGNDRDTQVELVMNAAGTARWRTPSAEWTDGEWDRVSRIITFTWLPDSTEWKGLYDPGGNSLLFLEEPVEGLGSVVLRRVFRRGG